MYRTGNGLGLSSENVQLILTACSQVFFEGTIAIGLIDNAEKTGWTQHFHRCHQSKRFGQLPLKTQIYCQWERTRLKDFTSIPRLR